ncbi:15298_t:CDS:2, partial [Gigaspora rosea]
AFVLKLFIAEMPSTSQVESYNAKIKRLIFNSNMTLLKLAEKLLVYILEEDKKTEYALFYPRESNKTSASIPYCKNKKKYATKIHC